MGSGAFPMAFPPRKLDIDDRHLILVDGSTAWNSNVMTGIQECLRMPGIESEA